MDDSTKGRYNMILGQDLLTELVLNLKLSDHVIEADSEPFKGSTTPTNDLGTYIFKYLNKEILHLNNRLLVLTLKKYMSHNVYVLLQNDYV